MPSTETDWGLAFVRHQGGNWIVEGVAVMKKPGNVRLDYSEFTYELHFALASDTFASVTAGESTCQKDIPLAWTRLCPSGPPAYTASTTRSGLVP